MDKRSRFLVDFDSVDDKKGPTTPDAAHWISWSQVRGTETIRLEAQEDAIGAAGPKMMRLAARYADEWNGFTLQNPTTEFFAPMLTALDAACRDVGRDPQTIRRSVDILVAPTGQIEPLPPGFGIPVHGSPGEIADQLATFSTIGISEVRTYLWPQNIATIEAMAPVLDELAPTPVV